MTMNAPAAMMTTLMPCVADQRATSRGSHRGSLRPNRDSASDTLASAATP